MSQTASTHRAFTLIELLAITIVLAILVGVAVPRYLDQSTQTRLAETRAALGEVRAAIANFYANGALTGEAIYPSLAELTTPGSVFHQPLPVNPFNGSPLIAPAKWSAANPPIDGKAGWNYDAETGRFWANSDAVGESRL